MMKHFSGKLCCAEAVVVAVALGVSGCGKESSSAPASTPPPKAIAMVATTNPPVGSATSKEADASLQKLKGRWLRPDGGYVLEIRQVDASGQLDASYLNPNPIRVTSSIAKLDGGAAKVFIELTDVNYPGCKYELTYVPPADLLVGTYYQAAMKQTFDVAFERMK